jgi:CheY-like chemotaxis protein
MSKRLLAVDDEPNILRAVAACLKAENYGVSTARSGHEALMRLAKSGPDLLSATSGCRAWMAINWPVN